MTLLNKEKIKSNQSPLLLQSLFTDDIQTLIWDVDSFCYELLCADPYKFKGGWGGGYNRIIIMW